MTLSLTYTLRRLGLCSETYRIVFDGSTESLSSRKLPRISFILFYLRVCVMVAGAQLRFYRLHGVSVYLAAWPTGNRQCNYEIKESLIDIKNNVTE